MKCIRGWRLFTLLVASALVFNFLCSASASAEAKETVLYSFGCGTDGCGPSGNLARDSQGNLYGTSADGGCCGTVFELTPVQGGGWSESVLHAFTGGTDGANPYSGVVMDASGNLYGTTDQGGTGSNCQGGSDGCGTVFKLTHSGSTWTESVLYSFSGGTDGAGPVAGVVFDKSGNLYGTTHFGGPSSPGYGIAFELSPSSEGWNEVVLHSFDYTDGAYPNTKLAIDNRGDLYGTTSIGGSYENGTVFRLAPSQGGWVETTIWEFTPAIGSAGPNGVIVHGDVLYGTTLEGGASSVGNVFQLTPAVGPWTYTDIYDFTGGRDGGNPFAGVTADPSHLYGTTNWGGRFELGTVFRLTHEGNGTWTEDVLYNFTGSTDGENPYSPLLLGPNGLFGFANIAPGGLVYEITAP
jgi:uncharacterized repeat protein (TIGR03803 family)